jgi:predicted aspartyl protease
VIRYSYNQQVSPPAPFVHVTLRCHETGKEAANLPGQLDTAADRTVIPGHLVEALGLLRLDELPVSGFGGQVFLIPTYRVELALHDLEAVMVEVLAHPEEPFILLGRDVLNRYRIVLDGPRLALEIG